MPSTIRPRSVAVLCASVLLGALLASASGAADAPDVELLRFPYPYAAELTVCSDTHRASVERFQAVHTLINTDQLIAKGSAPWRDLFVDPAIDADPAWKEGIHGFGLPIGDSIWLYDPEIGVFASFDAATGRPVPHAHDGRDYREIIDGWIRRGWIDSLHSAGPGDLPRAAVAAGLDWLKQDPHRRLTVWINHSIENTPSDIEPDESPALRRVAKNLAKVPVAAVALLGERHLARRIAVQTSPSPFPRSQRAILWLLSIALVGGGLALGVFLLVPRLRTARRVAGSALVVAGSVAALYFIPLHYALGDNPGSRYYNVDLARAAGFRFLNPIEIAPRGLVPGRLALPETSWGGRKSYLIALRLDDGSRIWMFPREYRGPGGYHSLDMLTDEGLAALERKGGASILYTHWISGARKVFTRKALEGLGRLKREYEAGRIWVAPTSLLLRFEVVRTFLRYTTKVEDGQVVIDIEKVADPIDGDFVPTVADLDGISFRVQGGERAQIELAGRPLPQQSVTTTSLEAASVLRIVGATHGPVSPIPYKGSKESR